MQNKTQIMEKVQVSDYFNLGLSQSQLEFVDVRLDTDIGSVAKFSLGIKRLAS